SRRRSTISRVGRSGLVWEGCWPDHGRLKWRRASRTWKLVPGDAPGVLPASGQEVHVPVHSILEASCYENETGVVFRGGGTSVYGENVRRSGPELLHLPVLW